MALPANYKQIAVASPAPATANRESFQFTKIIGLLIASSFEQNVLPSQIDFWVAV
jgi:hypothetical protein